MRKYEKVWSELSWRSHNRLMDFFTYHSVAGNNDTIHAMQARIRELRNLLTSLKKAEDNVARCPNLPGPAQYLNFLEERLAEFMYRNCGFPKPPPKRVYTQKEIDDAYNATILSIPLGASK